MAWMGALMMLALLFLFPGLLEPGYAWLIIVAGVLTLAAVGVGYAKTQDMA